MPVYAIIKHDANTFQTVLEKFNLEDFGFFTRSTIKETVKSIVKDISKKLPKDSKIREVREQISDDKKFKIIIQTKGDYRMFIITDGEYNSSVAYKLMSICFERSNFDELIKEYKSWETKDKLRKIEDELEKCHVIVAEGLDQILKRGESLSELVEKSETLSLHSKQLFKTAKKKNSCC